jgi:hypothetical protein
MPRLFASITRFSIWSDMPSPWRPPTSFAQLITSTGSPTGRPFSNSIVTVSGSIATSAFQCATPMIGSTICIDVSSSSRSFASCVAPSMFASVEYALSTDCFTGRSRSSSHSLISVRPPSSSTNALSSHGL